MTMRLTAILIILLLSTAACDEDVVLVTGTDHAYSLYGILNPKADTQYIHVFPIEGLLSPSGDEPLDASVRTTETGSGEVRIWADSLVKNTLGHTAHVYWSVFRPDHGSTYRVEVTGAEGKQSRAEVQVPNSARVIVPTRPGDPTPFESIQVVGNVPRVIDIEITYQVRTAIASNPDGSKVYRYEDVTIPFAGTGRWNGEGWVLGHDLRAAATTCRAVMARFVSQETIAREGVELLLQQIDMIVANDEWNPPGGVFDRDLLMIPEVMTNVDNGFGFIGAGYRLRHQWKPMPEALVAAGFTLFR